MRFSVIALAGLAAFGDHIGVQARATSSDLAVSSAIHTRNDGSLSVLEDMKRRLVSVLPRAPVVPPPKVIKPPTAKPPPGTKPGGVSDPDAGPPPAAKPGPVNNSPDAPDAPAPLKPANGPKTEAGAVCKLTKTRRSRLFGRGTYTKADASNPAKVMEWLLENEEYLAREKGVSKNKIIFYSTGSNNLGEDMAYDFKAKNPSWSAFDNVFGSKFSQDFGRVAPRDGDIGKATSKVLAQWSKNPIVFNTKSALPHSYWIQYELPNLYDAGTITKMKDGATSLSQTDGTIPTPPRPAGC